MSHVCMDAQCLRLVEMQMKCLDSKYSSIKRNIRAIFFLAKNENATLSIILNDRENDQFQK